MKTRPIKWRIVVVQANGVTQRLGYNTRADAYAAAERIAKQYGRFVNVQVVHA